jgi:predicted Zn-dependent protease
VPALLQIAYERLNRGEPAAAAPFAERAVAKAPRSFTAHNLWGRALLELGRSEDAIAQLEAATELASDVPENHFALARAYARAGRAADAERERAEFLRLDRMRQTR